MKFATRYDRAERNHIHMTRLPKFTRRQFQMLQKPMWMRLKDVEGNELAFRELMKQTHGPEMVINCIRGYHGLPNAN